MDYEKKYKDVLERARKQKYDYQKELNKTDKNSQLAGLLRAGISALEMAFPELAESEDERIRKWLVELVESQEPRIFIEVKKMDVYAWLERQKELPLMDGDADLYFDNWIQHNDTTKRGYFEEGIRYARRLQKEQKPKGVYVDCTEHPDWYGMPPKEQKPVEWHKFNPADEDNGVAFRIYADFVNDDGFITADIEDFGQTPPSHYLEYSELRELKKED